MNNYRKSAIAWWKHDLSKAEQQLYCDNIHKGRATHTLTGNEIEKIWKTIT